jgi:hypothetical protein
VCCALIAPATLLPANTQGLRFFIDLEGAGGEGAASISDYLRTAIGEEGFR